MSRFLDIRKTALVACVAGIWGSVIPVWQAVTSARPLWMWWMTPLMFFFSAILPVFCFALYRSEGTLCFPKHLRLLSLAAALALGIIVAADMSGLIGSVGPREYTSVLTAAPEPWPIARVVTLLTEFSNLPFILLLIALSREATDKPSADVPASRLLSIVTKVAVVGWGLWVAFNLVRVVLTPYTYFELRNYALQIGRTPPHLADMMADAIRTLLRVII
jgi:hypothetical protein